MNLGPLRTNVRVVVIIEPPDDPTDVEGWRDGLRRVHSVKHELQPDHYDVLVASFEDGLKSAREWSPKAFKPFKSLRERLQGVKRASERCRADDAD